MLTCSKKQLRKVNVGSVGWVVGMRANTNTAGAVACQYVGADCLHYYFPSLQAREPSVRPERGFTSSFTSSFALEHPKQQPCQYASALSMTALTPVQPRQSRATTVMPPSRSSVWRSNTNTFTQPSTATFSSYAAKFSSPGNSSRFSNIRSRFAY